MQKHETTQKHTTIVSYMLTLFVVIVIGAIVATTAYDYVMPKVTEMQNMINNAFTTLQ